MFGMTWRQYFGYQLHFAAVGLPATVDLAAMFAHNAFLVVVCTATTAAALVAVLRCDERCGAARRRAAGRE